MARITIAFTETFFKEFLFLLSLLTTSRLIDFALVVLLLLTFKVYGIIEISEIEFFDFPVLKGLNKIKKIYNSFKTS